MFARKNETGNYSILDNDGHAVTRILGANTIYPIDSPLSCEYEHSNGIELCKSDVELLAIEIEA